MEILYEVGMTLTKAIAYGILPLAIAAAIVAKQGLSK